MSNRHFSDLCTVALLSALAFSGSFFTNGAVAQQMPAAPDLGGMMPAGIRVTVGAMALYQPKFEGAKAYVFSALPIIEFSPITTGAGGAGGHSPFDARALDDVSFAVIQSHGFEIGPSLGYRQGRAEKESPRLSGLGDIDGGLVVGGFARYNFGPLYLRALFSHQVTGSDTGYLLRVSAGAERQVAPKILIKGVITLDYAGEDYMQAYFGVTPLQSTRSGLTTFGAGAGFKSIGALLSTEYALTADWKLLASAGYTRYLGDAASSPITEAADRFEARLGASRSFDWKMRQ